MNRQLKDPWEKLIELHRRLSEMAAQFFREYLSTIPGCAVKFSPECDLYRTARHLVIRFAVPGIIEDDLDVNLQGKLLTLRGERIPPADAESYEVQEIAAGYFERQILLPFAPDIDDLEISYESGIVEIRVPLSEEKP